VKVDVDLLKGTAAKHGVSAMPTFMFFKNGNKIYEFKGANPSTLQNAVSMHVGSSQTKVVEQKSPFKFIPQVSYIYWDTGKLDMILEKLLSFNLKFQGQESTKSISLDSKEISSLNKLIATLKNSNFYHASKFGDDEHLALLKAVFQWPVAERFPALDILRLSIIHPEGSNYHGKHGTLDRIIQLLHTEEPFANHLMELRFIANSFRFDSLRKCVLQSYQKVLAVLSISLKSDNKQVRIACFTILLNYAVLFTEESGNLEGKKAIIPLLFQGLITEQEEEGLLRVVVAFGTLGYKDSHIVEALKANRSSIESVKTSLDKVKEAIKEVLDLLDGKAPPPQQPSIVQPKTPSIPVPNLPTGGLPNIPGMQGINPNNVDTNLMAKMAQDPTILEAAQNPTLMAKLQSVMSNPSNMSQYQNDEELMTLVNKLMSLMRG